MQVFSGHICSHLLFSVKLFLSLSLHNLNIISLFFICIRFSYMFIILFCVYYFIILKIILLHENLNAVC